MQSTVLACFVALALASVSANLAALTGTNTGMDPTMGFNPGTNTGMDPTMGFYPGTNTGMDPTMGFNPGAAGTGYGAPNPGSVPLPLPPSQTANLWQQFFMYRMFFGDAAARIIMADYLANMMGGSPFSRYYAGEYFDTPDSWWMASSFANSNQQGAANPAMPAGAALPGTI